MALDPFDQSDPLAGIDDDEDDDDDGGSPPPAPSYARPSGLDEFVFYKVCGCGLPVPRHLSSYERDYGR